MSKKFIIILCIVSIGGLLFGFDMAVIAGALPLVKQFFGLSPAQEGVFVSSALLGCIVGVFFTGPLTDKYGRKPAFITAALLFLFSAIGCGFSPSYSILIASRSIGGLGVGIASIVVPLYLAEISPSKFRGRSVTCYQLAITFGILFAYISNYLILEYSSAQQNELWRTMFLVGAIPALLLCIGVYFIPESPRWLSKNGRNTEVAAISATLGLSDIQEVSHVSSKGNLGDLFSPIYRKAFLLGLFLPLFSQLSGINAIVYYGPSILLESGISLNNSYHAQLFFGAANVLFTFFAIWKVDNWGRRPLYLLGTVGATLSLLVTGYLFNQGQVNNIALIIAILSFLFFFAFSIGPLKFVVAAEIFPNAIRARAMGISIMVMWISDAIVGQLTPILLASWGARYTFWLFAFFCAIAFLVVLGFLPETKGKPLEEIEKFWIEKHNKKSTNK